MEVDILNDLLNRTISNIFQNKSKHLSYLSFDEDEEFSSEYIEKQLTLETKKQKQPEPQTKNQPEKLCTPELWITTIGKKKFEESMNSLNLTMQKIKSKFYVSMTIDQLLSEKAKVKSKLKEYDACYEGIFNKLPSRHEKEVMKPLYIYYRSLKNAIEKRKEEKATISTTGGESDFSDKTLTLNNNSNIGHVQGYGSFIQASTNTYTVSTLSQNTLVNHGRANSATAPDRGNTNQNFQVEQNVKKNKRSLSKSEVVALEKEYFNIKNEQNKLKKMLHKYQDEFQKNNNRKVKYFKDITPVEKEYSQYKSNKQRLKELKTVILENTGGSDTNNTNKVKK